MPPRLLPQPGGFAGFRSIKKALHLTDQPFSEREEMAPRPVHRRSVRPDPVEPGNAQCPVVEVNHLLNVDGNLVVNPILVNQRRTFSWPPFPQGGPLPPILVALP